MDEDDGRKDAATEDDNVQRNQAVIEDLLSRVRDLLSEVELLRSRLRQLRTAGAVEIAHFRGIITSEATMLERLHTQTATESSAHIARSSNLPFLENVWANVKKSKELVAIQKRVFFNRNWTDAASVRFTTTSARGKKGQKQKGVSECVIIDSITNRGNLWTKVSLVSNKRIIFDLAKQGWDSASDDEADAPPFSTDNDDDSDIPLLKTAKELSKASSSVRVHTRRPLVHLVLPRVQLGVTAEVDRVIEKCKATGVVVFCGEDFSPLPSLDDSLEAMVPDPTRSFSDVLNIDCTILLALVSDFSHARVTKEPWFHRALQRQVEIEDNENLLSSLLYPAIGHHPMVCTEEAAQRMREIVATIGTPSEKARTALLMGDDEAKSTSALVDEMQQWSAYPVSGDWKLPIKVVNQDEDDCKKDLPTQALAAGQEMTPINQSVFMHGWATGRTTITSNRIVVKQIEKKLEEYEDLDDRVWPKLWLCPTARSLVGKEKRGAKKDEKSEGAWPLPDTLRREHQRRNGLDVLSQREGREVEDLRPNGYPSEDVLAAKLAASFVSEQTRTDEPEC